MAGAVITKDYFSFIESILIIIAIAFGEYDCCDHDFEVLFSSFLAI